MKSAFFFFILASISAFAGPIHQLKTQNQFEAYLLESGFNGVLAVAQKEKFIYKKAYGVKDFITNTPLTTDDKFQIGSVSKQFAAVALLKLQEEQKLSIDDEVTKYLPALSNFKGIKIRDLLNHTAGVANYTDQPAFWQMVDYNKSFSLADITDFIATLPFDFSPKSKWKYSNSGYIIAGKIIEVVSHQSWDHYIKSNLLEPLQMHNSGYTDYFSRVSDVVGHVNSDEKFVPVNDFNMSWALSAGGLYSTIDDLLKWTSIYDDSALLNANSKIEMQTPFLNHYALGIGVEKFNDDIKISHGGRTPGFTTTLTYLKNSQLKIVKFDNTDGGAADVGTLALEFFATGSANALKLRLYPLDKAALFDYVGTFAGGKMNFKIFIKNDTLFLQPDDGQPAYPLVANDLDSFRLLNVAGEEFIRDQNGEVVELKHYQNGAVSVFKKVAAADLISRKRQNMAIAIQHVSGFAAPVPIK